MDFFEDGPSCQDDLLEGEEAFAAAHLEKESQKHEVETMLSYIKDMASDTIAENQVDEDGNFPETPPKECDPDLQLPEGQKIIDLTDEPLANEEERTAEQIFTKKASLFPKTLSQALAQDGPFWSNMWQLAVALRCGDKGMDSLYLRRAEVVRRRSRKLNWHQYLG